MGNADKTLFEFVDPDYNTARLIYALGGLVMSGDIFGGLEGKERLIDEEK